MANDDFLGQILGSVLGGGRGGAAGMGGMGAGGLGDVLGGLLGGGGAGAGFGARPAGQSLGGRGGSAMGGGGGALVAMLLPLAMQWVQRNGGIGAVLERFQQKGYTQQAASWVGTGDNEGVGSEAIQEVVGTEELSRLSQQLGASHEDVAGGLAQIFPQMVNHMTPQGSVPDDADATLERGLSALQQYLGQAPGR